MAEQSEFLKENRAIVQSLRMLPIIDSLEDHLVTGLISLCKLSHFYEGENIFEEDGYDQHIYFLLTGKVRIVKKGMEIATLSSTGDVFGEMCIIDAGARSASVYAVEESNCLKMDISYVDRLPPKERDVLLYIIYRVFSEMLSKRLRHTTEDLIKAKEEIARLKGEA